MVGKRKKGYERLSGSGSFGGAELLAIVIVSERNARIYFYQRIGHLLTLRKFVLSRDYLCE